MNGGRKHRDKGNRIERDIVERHKRIGVHAERYPLSGASRFRGSAHDIDLYVFGKDQAPLVAEVKGRKSGRGFTMLNKWLGDYDVLFVKEDRDDPLVVLPWRVWQRLTHDESVESRMRGTADVLQDGDADVPGASLSHGLPQDQRSLPFNPAKEI